MEGAFTHIETHRCWLLVLLLLLLLLFLVSVFIYFKGTAELVLSWVHLPTELMGQSSAYSLVITRCTEPGEPSSANSGCQALAALPRRHLPTLPTGGEVSIPSLYTRWVCDSLESPMTFKARSEKVKLLLPGLLGHLCRSPKVLYNESRGHHDLRKLKPVFAETTWTSPETTWRERSLVNPLLCRPLSNSSLMRYPPTKPLANSRRNHKREYNDCCLKPASFGMICYAPIDNWNSMHMHTRCKLMGKH